MKTTKTHLPYLCVLVFVCLQGILLVYDITNRWSFDGIDRWIREIDEVSLGDERMRFDGCWPGRVEEDVMQQSSH